jgi:hypothetical protein
MALSQNLAGLCAVSAPLARVSATRRSRAAAQRCLASKKSSNKTSSAPEPSSPQPAQPSNLPARRNDTRVLRWLADSGDFLAGRIASLRAYGRNPAVYFQKLFAEYGPVVRWRGYMDMYLLNNPDDVRTVLTQAWPRYTKRNIDYRVLRQTMGEHDAVHAQMGRFYPYLPGLTPGTQSLVRDIKTALDPRGALNPGVLGLNRGTNP